MMYKTFKHSYFSAPILAGTLISLAVVFFQQQAQASQPLLGDLGGPTGFGENFLDRNDDDSTGPLALPFAINFYGSTYDTAFLNNNGNITFESALSSFTPGRFWDPPQPIIAPWWADMDTNNPASGLVYYDAPDDDTIVFTWDRVTYFGSDAETTSFNSFQAILRNRADTGTENFDIEFRYSNISEWMTGDSSGGSGGFAGFGNGEGYFNLLDSDTESSSKLLTESNVSRDTPTPGLWSFAFRDGEAPEGTTYKPWESGVVDGDFIIEIDEQFPYPPPIIIDGGPTCFSSPVLSDEDTNTLTSVIQTFTGCPIFSPPGGIAVISPGAPVGTSVIQKSDAQAVPEPLTILGAGAAVGFMARFKQRMNRRAK